MRKIVTGIALLSLLALVLPALATAQMPMREFKGKVDKKNKREMIVDNRQGDKLKFKHGTYEFEQVVTSMQVDHNEIKAAKKGQAIGMKTAQPVHENAEVFKVEE